MKEKNTNTNLIAIATLVGVIAAGGGFFGGMKYQQSKRTQFTAMMSGGQGRMGGAPNAMRGKGTARPVYGEVIKADEKSITVKSRDGSSKIVLLSQTGQIYKAVAGTASDIIIGTQVSVFGTPNPDGSVTAENIQIASTAQSATPTPTK